MMRKNLLFIIILLITACGKPESKVGLVPDSPVKNVILMIGDGMGLAQINAARIKAKQQNKKLTIDSLPVTGLVNTYSNNKLSTDSAASATAFATGHKTNNGVIGLSPNGTKLKTILEMARENQIATGLIATSSLTHATPAAFATHVKHRDQQDQIAEQLLDSQIDIMLGGGKGFFLPNSNDQSLREDDLDLFPTIESKGYKLLGTRSDLISLAGNPDQKVLGLFAKEGLKFTAQEPSLAEMTRSALEKLAAYKNGFILVIEGSQIDWHAHYNETDETIEQTLLFDDAVAEALKFSQADQETLLLVTADHETGGMAITHGKLDGSKLEINWASKHHTPIDVPIYAYGPYAASFTGVQDNTLIHQKLIKILHF